MAITAQHVKDLRASTGAGMMDCKKALTDTGGDMDAAVDWLRKKGLSAAAKKSHRVASEGLVAVHTSGTEGAMIEVNSETDFVSRNKDFQDFATALAGLSVKAATIDALMALQYPESGQSVADELTSKIATIGENITLRRKVGLTVSTGRVVSYVHNAVVDGLGKIGVLVALESEANAEPLGELGKKLAMHIAATAPAALDEKDLDPDFVAHERQLLVDQAIQSGKSADIAEKMVEGRMKKFLKDVVLLDQIFVMDGETPVRKVVENVAHEVGAPITLKGFVRFNLGEGIEKDKTDFAAEVAAQLSG